MIVIFIMAILFLSYFEKIKDYLSKMEHNSNLKLMFDCFRYKKVSVLIWNLSEG